MTNEEKLFYHLAIWPYLDLCRDFDPTFFLQEISHQENQFKIHRVDYQDTSLSGRWKELEPKTPYFEHLLDLNLPTRIRYMLMEPHSKILSHQDSPEKPLYVLHACLTYPSGCSFTVGMGPQGKKNPFSKEVPFAPGKIFMINTSSFHAVENSSEENRYHLVALGRLQISVDELLGLAESQNGQRSEDELVKLFSKMKLLTATTEAIRS